MGQDNNIIKSKKGKHLNYEDRIKLEALYKLGVPPACIGEQLVKDRRTIERELVKGMVDQLTNELTPYKTYSATVGQMQHDNNATNEGPRLILLNNIPSSHLIPTKEEGILSADDDGQDALHKYCFELQKNKPATSKNEMTGLFLVEARRTEPLSKAYCSVPRSTLSSVYSVPNSTLP